MTNPMRLYRLLIISDVFGKLLPFGLLGVVGVVGVVGVTGLFGLAGVCVFVKSYPLTVTS